MDARAQPRPAPAGRRGGRAPVVRERRGPDLPALLALLQRTHEQEGYPVRAAAVRADWLASPRELWSAVAVDGDRVVGHVALHPAPPVDDPTDAEALAGWSAATGRGPAGLAVVSRLFTDRSLPGTGTTLLRAAEQAARDRDRVPVLLVDPDSPARAFYRRRGWREVGTARQQWGSRTVDAVLLVPAEHGPARP